MDKKDIIIIILSLIIIALLSIGAYNQVREEQIIYHTVNITDTFSLDVPISDNVTKTQVSEHMHIVNDSQNGIEINGKKASLDDVIKLKDTKDIVVKKGKKTFLKVVVLI